MFQTPGTLQNLRRNRESNRQDCHQTKSINQTAEGCCLVDLVQEICCRISSFQLPASGARPERTFYFPASGEHLRLAILGLGGNCNFRLPASSFGLVDVKLREFPGSRVRPAPPGIKKQGVGEFPVSGFQRPSGGRGVGKIGVYKFY